MTSDSINQCKFSGKLFRFNHKIVDGYIETKFKFYAENKKSKKKKKKWCTFWHLGHFSVKGGENFNDHETTFCQPFKKRFL